ncbi:MAG: hypothetical protein WD572_01585 [Gammaproteobacteria bacterium]
MAQTNPAMIVNRHVLIVLITSFYTLFYLYTIGDIDFGRVGWSWYVIPLSLERLLATRSVFHFEAIAVAELGHVVILISPVNLLIAMLIGLLFAANIDGALELRRQATCGISRYAGATGALPALLAGGACCAPGLLLLLGAPGLGALIGLFAWLVPVSVVLLMLSRVWQRLHGASPVLFIL